MNLIIFIFLKFYSRSIDLGSDPYENESKIWVGIWKVPFSTLRVYTGACTEFEDFVYSIFDRTKPPRK